MKRRLRQDIGRTILVIDDRPYLWAALSARIDRGTGYVRSATPSQLRTVWDTCRPWPWLVVGATRDLPDGLTGLLDGNPIPVYWCGPPPAGIPGRPAVFDHWQGLVDALGRLCEVSFNGVRLLRNRGLLGPEGQAVTGLPEVEGLLAAPELRLAATVEVARIRRELQDHHLPVDLEVVDRHLRLIPR